MYIPLIRPQLGQLIASGGRSLLGYTDARARRKALCAALLALYPPPPTHPPSNRAELLACGLVLRWCWPTRTGVDPEAGRRGEEKPTGAWLPWLHTLPPNIYIYITTFTRSHDPCNTHQTIPQIATFSNHYTTDDHLLRSKLQRRYNFTGASVCTW